MLLSSLSPHNKDLEQRTLKPSACTALGSWTNRATALRQISVTAPFYLEDSRRIQDSKRRERRSAWGGRKREKERERERARAMMVQCVCMCVVIKASGMWSPEVRGHN